MEKQSDNQGLSEGMEQVHEQVKATDYSNHTGTGTTATFWHCICMYLVLDSSAIEVKLTEF